MVTLPDWLAAFPIQPATSAVEAICEAWQELTANRLPAFNEQTKEASLTKRLKIYTDDVVSRRRGLLGMWSAEDVIGVIDPVSGGLVEERRTDIVYGWNDTGTNLRLVFEFKRLSRQKRDREHYMFENGMERFVRGIYARNQQVAAMVGILLDPEADVVLPLRDELESGTHADRLRMKKHSCGSFIECPSPTFSAAKFDTEHDRDSEIQVGPIRISHFFLTFGYPTSTEKAKRIKAGQDPLPVS